MADEVTPAVPVGSPVEVPVRPLSELRELAHEGIAMHSETAPERLVCEGLLWALDEVYRLGVALNHANDQTERFERGWYLRGDVLERLQQWAEAYPVEVFPEPLRQEWQQANEVLAQAGLSMTRMSASNMRHVISGVRKLVEEGLKA